MNIYVGNISYETSEEDLKTAFSEYGEVAKVDILPDKMGNNPHRGFGFVEMPNAEEAKAAIDGLNGKEIGGRALKVNEAKPRA